MATSRCPEYSKVVDKRKTKSPIWSYFGLPADENGLVIDSNVSICKLCKNSVSTKGGSTSNMFGHLKLHHRIKYAELSMMKGCKRGLPMVECDDPPRITTNGQSTGEQCCTTLTSKKQRTLLDYQPLDSNSMKFCTESVAKFLAFTMQPYNLVERKPFIDMIKTLNPRYKLPSRKYFSTTAIPKLYNDVVDKVKAELASVKQADVSFTTDCWTSVANTPYIAVTVHFIDQQWNARSACLSCTHFEENHTYDNISSMLSDILLEWGLDIKKLACCTTDNGTNILKAMSNLQLTHVSCFGHNINIGVNHALGLARIERAVARLKKLQSAISHSWKMKRDLKKAQEFLQMDVVALPSACPTRWWSTLKLIRRFLHNQLPIAKMLQSYPAKKHLMPEGYQVLALEDFATNTELLEDITTTLSGENYVTSSSVLPLYRKIKKSLQPKNEDGVLCKEIKTEILSALSERYENETLKSILNMSTLCDPRFRVGFTDDADKVKEVAVKKMADVYKSFSEPSPSQPGTSSAQTKSEKKGLARLLAIDDDEDAPVDNAANLPEKKAEIELFNYLAMPKVDLDTNPLDWWRAHETSFPILKLLAKKYLAIPGSSVPSERVFSMGGRVVTNTRASLLPKNVEMQVFLAQNKKYFHF